MTLIDKLSYCRYGKDNRRPRRVSRFGSLGGVFFIGLITILGGACLPIQDNQPTPGLTAIASLSTAVTPPARVSPTQPDCLHQPGQVVEDILTSNMLPRELEIRIYLPPCYDPDRPDPYPVLYLLHGLGYSDDQWPRLGVIDQADLQLMGHPSTGFLIVMPREQSGQDMVTAVLDVLLPYIEDTYNVRTDRAGRALGGISRGGGWVLSIAAEDPELFGAIGLHSTGVLTSITYLQLNLQDAWAVEQPRIWIDVGDRDTLLPRSLQLLELFDRMGWEYSWHPYPGGHTEEYWSSHLEEYLHWYLQAW